MLAVHPRDPAGAEEPLSRRGAEHQGPLLEISRGRRSLFTLVTLWLSSNIVLSSSRNSNTDPERRFAELERRLAAVEKRLGNLAAAGPDNDGWHRMMPYAKSRGISVRTVDRRVAAKLLEKKREGGCSYVREVSQSAAPPKRRRRPAPIAGDDGEPMSALPGGPVWPF